MTTVEGDDGRGRCAWARGDLARYHDAEWGVPLHGDAPLFEKLSLEGFQSGLSWLVVLRKREAFREAFVGFEPERVAAFGEADVERLLGDARLIRNRRKIEAVVANARAVAALREREGVGALDRLVWRHRPEPRPEEDRPAEPGDVPASTASSKELAAALKRERLVFVGPVTVYALMQSAGLVDDHLVGCWRARVSG
ncbi:DNA-3-methyladenine glycosylase I [Amnibacterium sp. CER49]|uniref:DNA-3-methyladenine glycosylase I n=1 Tax=Amnibacterium sp. CER49 TaxID=3039161 RepID=UPI00244D068B|nr:DNA-3-methyladenine glycosylase I [Amnibacterium sp. CER49]MDH2445085.1 DNA-3-methyladenine glycosylase I [Amnibacterium sp. CER49]